MIICLLLALLLTVSDGYCTWPPAYATEPGKGAAAAGSNSAGVSSGAAVNLSYEAAQPRLGSVVNCKYSVIVRSGPGTRYKK